MQMRLDRWVSVVAFVLLASGCSVDNPAYRPPGASGGLPGEASDLAGASPADSGHGGPDLSTAHADAAPQPAPDLTMPPPPPPPDMTMPGNGGMGAPCKIACDCQPGLACNMGQCEKGQFGPVYCCQAMNCPQGENCQGMDGHFGKCGGGGGGPPDGGGPGWCVFIPCQTDNGCQQAGCGFCNQKNQHCM